MKRFMAMLLVILVYAVSIFSVFTIALASDSDFSIENGVLKRYWGTGGTLVIPDGVTEIDSFAFANLSKPTTIVIPEGVTNIEPYAFSSQRKLVGVTLPSTLKSIGDDAFYGAAFTELKLPEGLEDIGENAFTYCDKMTTLVLPQSLKSIGNHAFSNCTKLSSVTIPKWVEKIGDYAFDGCSGLKSLTLADGLNSIGAYAFSSTSMVSVFIPDSVHQIGYNAFIGCKMLQEFAVSSDSNLYVVADGILFDKSMSELILYPKGKKGNSYAVPEGVRSIGDFALSGNSQLTSVTLPEGLLSIGNNAFSACSGLKEISYPDSLVSIGESAYSGCSGLKEIKITRNVSEIGEGAFSSCTKIGAFNVAAENKHYMVADGALFTKDQKKLLAYPSGGKEKTFTIPDGVISIGRGTFEGNTKLASITLPQSVAHIGTYAFYGCAKLKSMAIPEGVPEIGEYTFYECGALTDISLPESVKSIGGHAFQGCKNLKGITFPQGLENVGEYAFQSCRKLKSIEVPNSVTQIGNWAFNTFNSQTTLLVVKNAYAHEYARNFGNKVSFKPVENVPSQEEMTTTLADIPVQRHWMLNTKPVYIYEGIYKDRKVTMFLVDGEIQDVNGKTTYIFKDAWTDTPLFMKEATDKQYFDLYTTVGDTIALDYWAGEFTPIGEIQFILDYVWNYENEEDWDGRIKFNMSVDFDKIINRGMLHDFYLKYIPQEEWFIANSK